MPTAFTGSLGWTGAHPLQLGGQNPWYFSAESTSGLSLSTNAALAGNTTYVIGYVVMGT